MRKIKVTAQQRANAIEARDVMWPSVPPENVALDLREWRKEDLWSQPPNCGSVACFGGWCGWWPSFFEQAGERTNWNALEKLFHPRFDDVHSSIFELRGTFPSDDSFQGTDHELVTHRLNWLIENSEVVS